MPRRALPGGRERVAILTMLYPTTGISGRQWRVTRVTRTDVAGLRWARYVEVRGLMLRGSGGHVYGILAFLVGDQGQDATGGS